jgi:hypothetical protein
MSLLAMQNAITQRWSTLVATPQSLPTQYDNAPYEKRKAAKWARLTVLPAETVQKEYGNVKSHRTTGVIKAQLFGDLKLGLASLLGLVDVIRPIFSNTSADGVIYQAPTYTNNGRQEGQWQVTLTIPFIYDDTL